MAKIFLYIIIGFIFVFGVPFISDAILIEQSAQMDINKMDTSAWVGASQYQIPLDTNQNGPLIRYGYALVAHTSKYLGPKGIVQHSTNGMNCQNCHLEAGTKPCLVWY